jgi:hypothetical protein
LLGHAKRQRMGQTGRQQRRLPLGGMGQQFHSVHER